MRRALALIALLLALGCGSDDTIVVGSKNFTEQRVLGELLAQTIEATGVRVDRRLDLGGTFVCDAALRAGQIDVYVEYTGTALTAIMKESATSDPKAVLERVRAAYDADDLAWLDPLGFDNTFALVTRADMGATSISQAVPLAGTWRAAFGYEFEQRADGYPALQRIYGLRFAEVRTMDLGLLYRALVDEQVDLVVGNATDGLIDAFGLSVLTDDRAAFPPYEAVPVIRKAVLERHPQVGPALRRLAGTLDAATMRSLNHHVDGARTSPAEVVRRWRQSLPARKSD